MKKPKPFDIVAAVLLVLGVAAAIIFGVPGIITYADKTLGNLISDTVPRMIISALMVMFIVRTDYKRYLTFGKRGFFKSLLWSVPCFAVAIVNFPFSAMINGVAVIERNDLIWLFVLKCFSIALMEELFFRALLLPFAVERFRSVKYPKFAAVAFTAAVFGLFHVINLFFGASIAGTLLQVGYTFLLGAMFAVMLLRTENVWLCVAVHFIFDIGGTIITDLGSGAFQDTAFWILTAVVGVLCSVFIVSELWRMSRAKPNAEQNKENGQTPESER